MSYSRRAREEEGKEEGKESRPSCSRSVADGRPMTGRQRSTAARPRELLAGDGRATPDGHDLRERIERRTDGVAESIYEPLDDERVQQLQQDSSDPLPNDRIRRGDRLPKPDGPTAAF
jgi:hypothetical protein